MFSGVVLVQQLSAQNTVSISGRGDVLPRWSLGIWIGTCCLKNSTSLRLVVDCGNVLAGVAIRECSAWHCFCVFRLSCFAANELDLWVGSRRVRQPVCGGHLSKPPLEYVGRRLEYRENDLLYESFSNRSIA
jgi:hypothetical protein